MYDLNNSTSSERILIAERQTNIATTVSQAQKMQNSEHVLFISWLIGLTAGIVMMFFNWKSPWRSNNTLVMLRRALAQITGLSIAIIVLNIPSLVVVAQIGGSPTGGHDLTTFGENYSWSFGVGRPAVAVVISFILGTSISVHPVIRWLYACFLALELFLNAIAAVELRAQIDCIKDGMCLNGENGYHQNVLQWLYRREIVASAVELWTFFDVSVIGLKLGFVRNLYSEHEISVRLERLWWQLGCILKNSCLVHHPSIHLSIRLFTGFI